MDYHSEKVFIEIKQVQKFLSIMKMVREMVRESSNFTRVEFSRVSSKKITPMDMQNSSILTEHAIQAFTMRGKNLTMGPSNIRMEFFFRADSIWGKKMVKVFMFFLMVQNFPVALVKIYPMGREYFFIQMGLLS